MPNPSAIRSLFLTPNPTYTIAEAATLLGMDWPEVRGWVEVGELEGMDTDEGLRVPWSELVSFGMDFWSQEAVEEALGAEVADAIPELLCLTDLEVRIPRMEVVALERVAARDGKSVATVLARELLDFVSVNSAAGAGGSGVPGSPGVAGGRRRDGVTPAAAGAPPARG